MIYNEVNDIRCKMINLLTFSIFNLKLYFFCRYFSGLFKNYHGSSIILKYLYIFN